MKEQDFRNIEPPSKDKNKESSPRQKAINSSIFSLLSSLLLIIISLIIIGGLFFVVMWIYINALDPVNRFGENIAQTIMRIICLFIIVGGLFLSFQIYKILIRKFIKLFNLKNKIREDILNRYEKKN